LLLGHVACITNISQAQGAQVLNGGGMEMKKKCNIASSVYRHGMEVRTTQHQVSLGTAWNILQRNIMLMETVWTGGFYSVASSVSAHGMDDFSAWHHM
jgi:hypothetical protein